MSENRLKRFNTLTCVGNTIKMTDFAESLYYSYIAI